ncbi:Cof-type HAD-IIB family hydrolase [Virgibacillus doumboii]|uniref:Cof-type HAD-IIB family hydrolase n=1 Tax=Virgibacillus doumboii TaxID=2697503 RepID=UPI0013E003FC|nr:Cof-type HAD-IIB family hydrolase [Virgibacillus doumboii]
MSIIAIDLDGTLINSNHKVSEENIAAIKQAQKLGHEVVIATGRAHFDVQKILSGIGLSLYTIGANGATIHSPSGTNILSVTMPEQQTRSIIEWLDQEEFYYELFCESGIYTPKEGKEILQAELNALEEKSSSSELDNMKLAYEKQIGQYGFVFMESYEKVFEDRQKVHNILAFSFNDKKRKKGQDKFAESKNLTLVSSSKYNFELEHFNASKGKALRYLAKVLNMNMDHSMAIGDSENDISMFKVVSNSFAMENADRNVQSHARYLAPSQDDHGVAKAIGQFLD